MYDAQPTRAATSDHVRSKRVSNKVKEITFKRAASGGYIATHHFDNSGAGESYRSPEDHVITGGHEALSAHLGKHFGGQKPAPSKAAGRRASRMHGRGVD